MNRAILAPLCVCAALAAQLPQAAVHPDHHEFEAALAAPFRGGAGGARTFQAAFLFPDAEERSLAAWRVELLDPAGRALRTWHGETLLVAGRGEARTAWDGRDRRGRALAPGFYTVRLTARALTESQWRTAPGAAQAARVEGVLAVRDGEEEVQETTIRVGNPPAPALPAFRPLPVGRRVPARREALAAGVDALPYTVLYGNMHSQTNHSDGGSPVTACGGTETPQVGTMGPADAYEMMRVQAGGDFLLTSEHNHMYDGSTSTNTAADPAAAKALWQSGMTAAAQYRTAHPEFMALYGNEWGVITNGGHLNLLNPDGLPSWEYTASNQLIGDVPTPKSDYPALYATMKQRGWIGQFNHPKTTGQFLVGTTPLGYDANGDEVMALCEVANTSAFSVNLTETETAIGNYEAAWNILLERGYHLAPTTDQDNHCANWGLSSRNRTGVLIPAGTPLTVQAFLDAVKARRVFATMDKAGQLVLTADGHLMGERFDHSGSLTLQAHFANSAGRAASRIQFMEGVPGRNGTVTQLAEGSGTHTLSPSQGAHFYYAIVTEDNGDRLWSAPVWVNQLDGPATAVTAAITDPAADLTVASGAAVPFAAAGTTTGPGALSYVWDFGDGTAAAGAAASHAFTNAGSTALARTVTLTVSDGSSSASATRVVTVSPAAGANTAPTIGAVADQATAPGTPVGPLAFTVGDAETAATALTVTAASSNTALLPASGITLGGSGASRTVTLAPAPGQAGSATVTLTVADAQGATATARFTLTVQAASAGGRVILSQYYEGANSDRWIELTNVGTTAVDLAAPQQYLALFANAAADAPSGVTPTSTQALSGTLAPGQSILFKASGAVAPAYAVGTVSGVAGFNGDDLVILTTTTGTGAWAARQDVVGNGNTWGADTSFVRKATVSAPNPTFDLAEWTQVAVSAVDGAAAGATERLGYHAYTGAAATVSAAITAPAADLTVAHGASVAFTGGATDSNPNATLGYAWTFGDGATATGATASHTFSNPGDADRTFTVTFTATDGSGASGSATRLVTVTPGPDTTAPTVSAAVAGTQGALAFSATASDNRGVTKVEFYVDGALKGSATAAPYGLSFDSTTVANGSHSLVAKAYDAAGNAGSSAPVAFTVSNPDTQAPTVSASVTGTSGTLSFAAAASDNLGVARVDFYVDGVLKGSDTTAPYGMTLDSTTLANGGHSLVAKASDAAGNVGSSAPAAFTVGNPLPETQLLQNPGFESGATAWSGSSGVITNQTSRPAHAGTWYAWLNGYGSAATESLYQQVALPSTLTSATLSFWLRVDTAETTTSSAYDTLKVQVRDGAGTVLATLATYSNLNKGGYVQKTFDLSAYKGRTIRVHFLGAEDASLQTSFVLDDVTLTVK